MDFFQRKRLFDEALRKLYMKIHIKKVYNTPTSEIEIRCYEESIRILEETFVLPNEKLPS